MSSLADHKNAALQGSGSLADREAAFWSGEAVGPSGKELDYAENISGTGTTIAGTTGAVGTPVDIPNCIVDVPISNRPVWIRAGFAAVQSVVGLGSLGALIVEVGGSTIEVKTINLTNDIGARANQVPGFVEARIGPTVVARQFKLQARCDSKAGATPSCILANLPTSRSYIEAVVE